MYDLYLPKRGAVCSRRFHEADEKEQQKCNDFSGNSPGHSVP
jgi:hypothetical protein